jgi:signal transduction histidine kinase
LAKIDKKNNLDLMGSVLGDQRRFLQILSNFLSNSLKFTNPGGSVTVKLQVTDQQVIDLSESYISLRLSVVDTGIGMSEEGVKNLFVDFGRLAENENRNKGGTGLGLSICK